LFTYEEAVQYIEDIPKFTTKNKLEHTRQCLDSYHGSITVSF